MGGVEGDGSLLEPLERLARLLGTVLPDPVLERASAQVLHDNEGPLRVLADVEDGHDVRLSGQSRCRERLSREPLTNCLVA